MKRKAADSKPRVRIKSTQAFSPFLGVKDNLIATKDGQFIKLMEIAPINFELRSGEEQDEVIDCFGAALRTMPREVHLKIINIASDLSSYAEHLNRLISNEKSEGCRQLLKDQKDFIMKSGSRHAVSRRFFLSFKYEQDDTRTRRPDFNGIKEHMNRQARSIANSLETCGNSIISFEDDRELESLLFLMMKKAGTQSDFVEWEELVRNAYDRKIGKGADEGRIPINYLLSPYRLDFSISPRYALVDNTYVMCCYIPSSAYPVRAIGGWTQVFFMGIEGVNVDIWIRKEDVGKVKKKLSYELKSNWIRQRHTDDVAEGYEDIESALKAGYYIKSAIAEGDDLCYMATMITITAPTVEGLNIRYKEIKDYLLRNDLRIKNCLFQQEEAYLSTLPLVSCNKSIFNKSRRNITGSQLGSCYPFTAYELNDEGGIFFGVNPRYDSPVFLNIFDRRKYSNANMLILGPTGSGKTYTLLTMLLRMRESGLRIFTIAPFKGSEFMRACEAVGGEFVRIAPGSAQNINIMEIRKHDNSAVIIDGEIAASGSVLTAKIQQIERFFSILLKDISVQESHILDDALIETYRGFGITVQNKSLYDPNNPTVYRKMPVLGDLYKELESRGDSAHRMLEALSRYVTGSARSFNQPTNVDLGNKFVVLDVSEMTNEMLAVGMFIALDYVLDGAKADRTENKVIAIDEMWRLMSASPMTSEFTVEVFKIIRGYGGSAIGATQDLDDVLKDKSGAAIINNAKFKFFLPMERKEAEAVAKIVDISAGEMKQMKISKSTVPGTERKILMAAGANHVFVSLRTSKREHDLITTNADDLRRIAKERGRGADAV